FADARLLRISDVGAEADRTLLQAVADDLLEPRKRAAADEQNVGRIDLQELLLRVLTATLRRDGSGGAFHQLEQGLLHAFARDIAGDRRILRLAGDLVDLVDVDDAVL